MLYELSLFGSSALKGAIEILRNVLILSGVDPNEIVHIDNGYFFTLATYFPSKIKATRIKKRILHFKLKKITVKVRMFKKEDWQDKWKEDFHAFSLTKSIDIVPVWEKEKYRSVRRAPVFIDPQTAFGTGLHETTKFMARLIEHSRGRFNSFLDIGTGTGILSLIAFKCKAKDILAIDIDKNGIKAARNNFLLNECPVARLKQVDISKWSTKSKFDFVAANLITHDLIKLKRKICFFVKAGQYLAVSGIALENLTIFKKAYSDLPLRLMRMEKGKHWVALLFKRIK